MAADFLDDTLITDPDTGVSYDTGVSTSDLFNSDTLINGDGSYNAPPLVSDNSQTASDGGYTATTQNLLGSVGSIISNLPQTAKAVGTAVGNTEHQINQAGANYTSAKNAAASGNNASTWWQYASNTDKAMILLAVVGIVVALRK